MGEKIPKGYKQTEVGVIPEDWEVKTVDEIADVKSGKRLPLGKSLQNIQTSHPYIRVADMFQGGVSLSDIKYVPNEIYPSIRKYKIFKDDIFISVAGTLGIVGKIPEQLDGANLTENADCLTNIRCDRNYILYIFMSSLTQSKIESEMTLGAQPKIALTRIRKFLIPVPSTMSEQTAIAQVLSDMDALIENLDKLIAKKKLIKKGAMQELLTGKRRLPGFSGKWEVKKLGEIAEITKGQGLSKGKLSYSGKYFCILYGELFTRYKEEIFTIWSKTSVKEGRFSKHGDVLLPGSTTTIGIDLAKASALMLDDVLLGGDINIIRQIGSIYNPVFLAYCLTHIYRNDIAQRAKGITVYHLHRKDLYDLEIRMPNCVEQSAIALVLSDMDAEIEALEKKRDKYKLIKQGAMQLLLTGKVRLV